MGTGWGGVIQDVLELLFQGPWGQQAIGRVGPYTEESAPVEDSHMSAVLKVTKVVWRSGVVGGRNMRVGRGYIRTTPLTNHALWLCFYYF